MCEKKIHAPFSICFRKSWSNGIVADKINHVSDSITIISKKKKKILQRKSVLS